MHCGQRFSIDANSECGKAMMKMSAPYIHQTKKRRPLSAAIVAGIKPKINAMKKIMSFPVSCA
ncbi:hypothetical protein PSEUDO8Z_10027 [Pseudomonas sp. 8Z]|nr:hypothetical protein PSEUDO8Z_10027 [Pseudomonas sp. 8Z]